MISSELFISLLSDCKNSLHLLLSSRKRSAKLWIQAIAISLLVVLTSFSTWCISPALATINDDRYEGNVFVLFGGNGSLVPPRMDLPTSLKKEKPAILVFYVDDSSDCKQFSGLITRVQEFYGRAASIIPVTVDSFIDRDKYTPDEPAYYYSGVVPETVILDQKGKVVYDGKGQVPYEEIDDVLREVFNLLPRSESQVLKRRSFNEFNSGMAE
ncbi:thylakoid membrane photosystem I accumulation factor [Waterburya agarophytonicola K14]|uniref:Thylakoid membrane photosystem I accumulation factor n=1 Tax=Waterburya agarophytonicola KI4 TaxID=2874699 RepID=A0A964BT01_9CYAN|nr:thylakoid membrane photosystem I accumulation factor [Waterburya agarophytonicola]MCC0177983.1 thylakoid membrane photosystem I accumulation factor [Waterburya agarophytonicola KI4]